MNALTAGTPQTAGSQGISVLSVIKRTGNVASAALSSRQLCCQRNALNVKRNVNSSTSRVTPLSAAGPAMLIHV